MVATFLVQFSRTITTFEFGRESEAPPAYQTDSFRFVQIRLQIVWILLDSLGIYKTAFTIWHLHHHSSLIPDDV